MRNWRRELVDFMFDPMGTKKEEVVTRPITAAELDRLLKEMDAEIIRLGGLLKEARWLVEHDHDWYWNLPGQSEEYARRRRAFLEL